MSKYDFELDLECENSLALIIDMIKSNSKILEFGPANGRLTKYLNKKMQCIVDIVEIDEQAGLEASKYSNESFIGEKIGDIEKYIWLEKLECERYDYIIFADVLEHLRFPDKVLRKCNKILNDNGSILISVPNIAHNSVIIDLINDEFKYNNLGLLDNTHMTFFSYKSLKRMIEETGYQTVTEKAFYSRVGNNEIVNNYNSVSREFAKALRNRENGTLYQFVFELKKQKNAITQGILQNINLDKNSEYKLMCYIKEENGATYSENKTITKFVNPGYNNVKFEFSKFKQVHELRVDPLTCNCIINIKEIYTMIDNNKININIMYTNGINIYDSIYIFSTNDPQIYLNINGLNINELYFECDFIDYDSDKIPQYYTLFKQVADDIATIQKQKEIVIREKEENIKAKETIIKEKEKSIREKEITIKDKENYIEEIESRLKEKEKYIHEIENSRSWKYVKKIKKITGRN